MFNTKYVSIKQIIDKVKRGKLFKELSYEAAIDYGVECYRMLSSEKAEVTKPFLIKVESYRAALPDDFERMMTSVYTDEEFSCVIPMAHSTGLLNDVRHCIGSPDLQCVSDYSYTLNNNYMHTNFEEGWVMMVYKGLKCDSDGMIMIPDEPNTIQAVSYYIKWRFLDDLGSDEAHIRNERDYNDQQYCWYIATAQSAMTDMSYDEYEALANQMSKFFINDNHFNTFMNEVGVKEYIVNQRYG